MRAQRQTKRRARKPRPYHLADDAECVFEYELPEWLVGAD